MTEDDGLNVITVTKDMILTPDDGETFFEDAPDEKPERRFLRPSVLFGAAVAVWAVRQACLFLKDALSGPFLSGVSGLTVFGLASAAAVWAVRREIAAVRAFGRGKVCRETESQTEARAILANRRCGAGAEIRSAVREWNRRAASFAAARDVRDSYSALVLEPFADKKAAKAICSNALQAAALVATSPFALTDMLFVFASNLRMTAQIAECYGAEMSLAVRFEIFRTVFRNMLASGGAEMLTDAASSCGIGFLGKFSARTGQGLLTGFYAVRLGIKTAELCRPVAFNDKNRLTAAGLFPMILTAFKESKPDETQKNSK